jgi:hypothetical protein
MFSTYFHSFLLAQLIGFYFLIIAIIMLARVNFYRRLLLSVTADYPTIIALASFGLVVGLVIVLTHNFWVWIPHVLVVTIIGWLILIKAILWLSLPDTMAAYSKRVYSGPGYYVVMGILAIIGMILLSKGFYPFSDGYYPDFR